MQGGGHMRCAGFGLAAILGVVWVVFGLSACGEKGEKAGSAAEAPVSGTTQVAGGVRTEAPAGDAPATRMQEVMTLAPPGTSAASAPERSKASPGAIIEVDGVSLTQGQLDAALKQKLSQLKLGEKDPQLKDVKATIRKQVIDEFVVRTLLKNEAERQKISVTDREIAEATDQLKKNLPQGVRIDDLLKESKMSREKMNEEIREGIRVNKLVLSSQGPNVKPTEKEILDFYQKNRDRFKVPESVRVRHILVKKTGEDDEKAKAGKRARAEELRKQLVSGADFAELAKAHSDCPSKEAGGDLGVFTRGQMVKAFEDAAFGQQKNAIGPVVETEFGYHVIQVLERNNPKTLELDDKLREMISAYIEQKRREDAFAGLVAKLRTKANIVVHGQ